jgi:K+-transporting ATPase ATPase A chain
MVGSVRHGAALLAAMVLIFGVWVGFTSYAEHQQPGGRRRRHHCSQPTGNTEGKEVRFGDTTTALFGVASTMTSTGSADASYDSFTPIGGFGPAHRHDARRGDPGRHRAAGCTRSSSTPSSPCSSAA